MGGRGNDGGDKTAFGEDEPRGEKQRLTELNDPIVNPVPLVNGRKQPEITLEEMEVREWLKTYLGY